MPTRILGRRPSFSCSRATSARSSARSPSSRDGGGLADAGRGAVAAEHLAQRRRPLAGRRARPGGGDRRLHQVRGVCRLAAPQLPARRARRRPPPGRAPRASARTSSICSASSAGSTTRMPPSASAVSGDSSVSVKRFWPTTTCSPDSMRRSRSRWESTSARLHVGDGLDRAAVLGDDGHLGARPPAARRRARPSPSSPRRCPGTRGCRFRRRAPAGCAATTAGPTAAAGPSASFQAGSWIARARASRPSVTASASSTIRCTLFSGWASVRPERVDLHAVAEAQVALVRRRRSARGRAPPTGSTSRAASRAPR